jgi:hypothetical protein
MFHSTMCVQILNAILSDVDVLGTINVLGLVAHGSIAADEQHWCTFFPGIEQTGHGIGYAAASSNIADAERVGGSSRTHRGMACTLLMMKGNELNVRVANKSIHAGV